MASRQPARILGIDPGTETTGWGVISALDHSKARLEGYGTIKTDSRSAFQTRLDRIFSDLQSIIQEYRPEIAAVEELFFAQNVKTAVSVGHARGVVLLAAARSSLEVKEYTPLEVKMALVGYGRASKVQVQTMVKVILGLKQVPRPDDAADALAVAICHFHTGRFEKRVREDVRIS